jgi:hypothetical protein
MSERPEKRLGDAKSITEAMRMIWLGKDYSPRVVKIIDYLISLRALRPEHSPARHRYALALAEAIEAASPNEIIALAAIKKTWFNSDKDWKQSNSKGWPQVLDFALKESAKIEAGTRTNPIDRDELNKFLLKSGKGHFTPRHLDHMVKALRSLGVDIVAPKGRPPKAKRRTK